MGLKKGDWFWTSPISFVASANCGLYCGAKVDFVDIDPKTYNLSIDSLSKKLEQAKLSKKLPKIVIPVSFAGQSCELSEIKKLSKIYKFKILEDSSHALGGKYKDQPIGNCKYADISVFSFHPVKMITTGEGGMLLTDDEKIIDESNILKNDGRKERGHNLIERRGYNLRITEFQSAIGLAQLSKSSLFVKRKRELLVTKKQRDKLLGLIKRQGATLIPIKIYFNDKGLVKVNLGVAKGRKKQDKREMIKQRDWDRQKAKIIKDSS